ncbi:MAG: lysozyme inhibitor LprI family protein [Pseudomonadota bacterium]
MRWLALTLLGAPASAQDIAFDPGPTEVCVASQDNLHSAQLCAGKAAIACMEMTEGGFATVVMSACSQAEAMWWDARLNKAYQETLAASIAADSRAQQIGMRPVGREEALRAMQRAWIAYRDGLCAFERSKWGGGTGQGPAGAGCNLQETARQTLLLEEGLSLQ